MANILSFKGSNKKKIETIRRQKTTDCRTICICSLTSTIHILVPIIKVLHRLGTVQIISEDKSVMLLSPSMESKFILGDIHVEVVDEIVMLEQETLDSFNEFNYNIVITHDFLPECDIDKYIMLNRRHHYRAQIDSNKKRYTPIFSVFNPQGLGKEERAMEQETVYVNERLLPLPPFAVTQDYLSTLLMGVGKSEFKVNSKILDFVVEVLTGIDECTKQHIRTILFERGELFVSPS